MSVDWGEIFKEAQRNANNNKPSLRYFLIKKTDYTKNSYPTLKRTVKNIHSKMEANFKSGTKILQHMKLEDFYNKKFQLQLKKERYFWSLLKNKYKNNQNITNMISNIETIISSNNLNELNIVNYILTVKKLISLILFQNNDGDNLAEFYQELISDDFYKKLYNPVQSYFSRTQLLQTADSKIKAELGQKFFDKVVKITKDKKMLENTTDELTAYLGDLSKNYLFDSLETFFVSKSGGKRRNARELRVRTSYAQGGAEATQKRAIEQIIRQHYWRPLREELNNGEVVVDTIKIKIPTSKGRAKSIEVNVTYSIDKFEIQQTNGNIIVRVGELFSENTPLGKINNKEDKNDFIQSFYTIILDKLKHKEWFRENGKKFLNNVANSINVLKVYNNAGVSGLLKEMGAALITYSGLGDKTSLLGTSGKHRDVVFSFDSLDNQLKEYGIQSKSFIEKKNNIQLYKMDGKGISLSSKTALDDYLGEILSSAIQYLLVNNSTVDIITGEEISISEIQIIENFSTIMQYKILNLLRYKTNDNLDELNYFYFINGRLIPTSVIIVLTFFYIAEIQDTLVETNLFFSSPRKISMEESKKESEVKKNIVNADSLKKSKIYFKGLNINFKDLGI